MIDLESASALYKKAAGAYSDLEKANDPLGSKKGDSQETRWMRTVLISGTLLDKLSALSMLIQREPLYSLKHLQTLMKMALKNSKREAEMTISTLKQVFLESLLSKNQKLKTFTQYMDSVPTEKRNSRETLIKAYIEHNVKRAYRQYIERVDSLTKDTVIHVKKTMMETLLELLMQKPEEEKTILSMLVNKYGDKEKKAAKYVSTLLKRLLKMHPNMSGVVLRQIAQFASKNVPPSSVTLMVRFVNKLQSVPPTILREVIDEKIKIYFGLLNAHLKASKNETEAKTVEKLLKGLVLIAEKHKSKLDSLTKYVTEHDKELYKLSYVGEIKARVYSLKLLLYIEGNRGSTPSSRFYRSLYELQLSVELMESSMLEQYFTILLQSIKQDNNPKRVSAILKRLLQQSTMAPLNYVVASLLVFSKAISIHPSVAANISAIESASLDNDEDEEHFKDVPDSDDEDRVQSEDNTAPTKATENLYDWHKRDPQFANADKSCFWELTAIMLHYHPLVSQWANDLLKNGVNAKLEYEGKNPILDFKIINLLDRMTYKEPKKNIGKSTLRASNVEVPITSYWKELQGKAEEVKSQGSIKPHEEFFAKYFETRDKKVKKKVPRGEEDMDEVADNIIEEEMRKVAGDPDLDDAEDVELSEIQEEEAEEGGEEPFSDLEDEGAKWDQEDLKDPSERTKSKRKGGKNKKGKKRLGPTSGETRPGFKAKKKKFSHKA